MGMTGRIENPNLPKASLRELRQGLPKLLMDIARYWHKNLLPKHFTTAGAREYGYQDRTLKYKIRKRKTQGHNNPLVWEGDLRDAAMSSFSISTTKKKAKLVMPVPRYAYQFTHGRGVGGKPINKVNELLRLSQSEADMFVKMLRDGIVNEIETTRTRETRMIR